ncbi:MAG: chemotaxis protein CheW [Candidatus Cloacimonetes bacterium]|nr:chemotaxis protein CheW [Candidatus Cloacimonadota bacterium]
MSDDLIFNPKTNEGKYLTFNLLEEQYGISVYDIMQIIAIPNIIKIPQTPHYVKGVINLRGKIIPVMDLRLRFSLPEQEYDDKTSIIVISLHTISSLQNTFQEDQETFVGIIVDKVLEVIDIHANDIESKPTFGVELDTDFILAMAKVKNIVVTLLDMGKILTSRELEHIQKMKI